MGLGDGDGDGDQVTFGIRALQLDPRHGLRLNGETVMLRGACVHRDKDHFARTLPAVLDGLQIQWTHDPTVNIAAIAETFTRMLTSSGGSDARGILVRAGFSSTDASGEHPCHSIPSSPRSCTFSKA
ncbi:hypothetical protein [Streptomyces griseus]|uniref:hypothetical protein n=1 Tax=Streptomyces griseus TaxID=1911 RepID=UPI00055B5815|nr:hypothetical protein [Streptomyces griseus]